MTITDIEGAVIEITNLHDAIEQATLFASMKHDDKEFEKTDKYLKAHWNDILKKLETLQNT